MTVMHPTRGNLADPVNENIDQYNIILHFILKLSVEDHYTSHLPKGGRIIRAQIRENAIHF